ncbi:MAG: DUF4352 domain-containing protein [Chloroflexi bacterium]|nr:DUF4352 domain-containing protein [Chloroflexota bacterium]
MAMQPDILQNEIARRTGQGWVLVSREAGEAQMRKPKRFSFVWAFLWFLLFGIGILIYLFWHWAKSDQLIFLRVVEGQLVVTGGGRGVFGVLFAPFGAWWRWAGERSSTQGKVLAYGGPVAAVIVLIIIISVASATGGGGDGDGEQVAGQPTEAAAVDTDDQESAEPTQPSEPTDTPEPEIEGIVTAVPGAVAEADDVRITLNEITDPWVSDNQFIQPDPGRRFVAFDVTIENTGGSGTHGASIFKFRLSDAEDFAYEASFFGPEPSLSSTDLGSGQKTRGWLAFEVNEGTPLQVLKYDPRLFSTNDIEFHFQ